MVNEINAFITSIPGQTRVLRNLYFRPLESTNYFKIDYLIFYKKGAFFISLNSELPQNAAELAAWELTNGDFPIPCFRYKPGSQNIKDFSTVVDLAKQLDNIFKNIEDVSDSDNYFYYHLFEQFNEDSFRETYKNLDKEKDNDSSTQKYQDDSDFLSDDDDDDFLD